MDLHTYPLILDASDIAEILRISRAGAYQLLHRADFPVLHVGTRLLVPRDQFCCWIEAHTSGDTYGGSYER